MDMARGQMSWFCIWRVEWMSVHIFPPNHLPHLYVVALDLKDELS